ncbi:MAG: helix-turn-helix domain-containing protein [Halobacteriales archaeon]
MAVVGLLELYNLGVGLVAGAGMVYLLYSQRFVVGYRRFLTFVIAGFLLFSVGGPLVDILAPAMAHVVHGTAALLVVLGLYDPVGHDLRTAEWAELVLNEPGVMRAPADWMTPMDDEILELFHSTELVLTPAVIAHNLDYTRESVNRRLRSLQEHGLVERVERGKYRLTELGAQYLNFYPADREPVAAGETGETGS